MSASDSLKKAIRSVNPRSAVDISEAIIHWIETVAAFMLVFLFLIGVYDLGLQLYTLFSTGVFTDPNAVIDILDIVLLFLIIVEVYETIIAYAKEEEQKQIVLTVIYAGAIAMIRKIIIFRPTEYETPEAAFITAGSYVVILFGLSMLLLVTYRFGGAHEEEPSDTPRDATLTGGARSEDSEGES